MTTARRFSRKASSVSTKMPEAARRTLSRFGSRIAVRAARNKPNLSPSRLATLRHIIAAARKARRSSLHTLFAGESGTGKTMAARVLAGVLKLPLYRIDLSAVVSKHIGETEKNLAALFAAAEEADAILLFDEADALFGKRTGVRDAHDRYANLEANHLLQRLERYDGLVILTTNSRDNLDPAVQRRLRFVVDFPIPDITSRARAGNPRKGKM